MCPACGNRVITKCKFCGRDFLPKYRGNVFCSSKCSQDYRKDIWKKDTIKYIDETGLMPVFNGKVLFNETNRKAVKMYLIAKFGHRCSICGTDSWLGKPVPLVVDHADGDPFNHSVDNFRLVCGNCNMQLPTFTSRNYGKGRKLGKLRKKN